MTFRLRQARVSEAAALSDLAMRSKAHWGYDDAFMQACRAELTVSAATIEAGHVWVCEAGGGDLAGFFDLRLEDDVAEVYDVFVDPPAMGQGAGSLLWRKLEEVACEMGARKIGIDADPNAVGYYEHMGAKVVGEAPSGSIPGRMLPRMIKSL